MAARFIFRASKRRHRDPVGRTNTGAEDHARDADADASKGQVPKVKAGALVRQAVPNDGILNTVGGLGAKVDDVAFDIWSDGTKNEAWAMTGDQLWSIDLATGKATLVGRIEGLQGAVKDIAILSR